MRRGVIPGLIAGYFFLAYAGSPPTLGFAAHLLVSIVIGSLYTGVFMLYVELGSHIANIIVGGSIYGLIWWIIGWNVIMPLLQGDSPLQFFLGPSFYGHVIFAHTLAFLVVLRDSALGIGMGWRSYSSGMTAEFLTLPILLLLRLILFLTGIIKAAMLRLHNLHVKGNVVERAERRTIQPRLTRRAKLVKSKMMPQRLEAGKKSHSAARHKGIAEALDAASVDYALVPLKGRYHLIFLPPDDHRIIDCDCIVCAAVNQQGLKLSPYRGRPPAFSSYMVLSKYSNCEDRWKIDRDGNYRLS